jgi:hypothetical protein
VNQYQFILICLTGWINRNQQNIIDYLQEEVKVLKEPLGEKPRLNDDQHPRLITKTKKIGLQQRLKEIAVILTPRTLLDWHQRLIASNTMAAPSGHWASQARRQRCAI